MIAQMYFSISTIAGKIFKDSTNMHDFSHYKIYLLRYQNTFYNNFLTEY